MNWKSDESALKENDGGHLTTSRRHSSLNASNEGSSMDDKKLLVCSRVEGGKSSESTSKSSSQQSIVKQEKCHLADISNLDLLKDCRESRLTGSEQAKPSLAVLSSECKTPRPVSPCRVESAVLVVKSNNSEKVAERGTTEATEVQQTLRRCLSQSEERSRSKSRRRNDGKIRKTSRRRQEKSRNYESIRIVLQDNENVFEECVDIKRPKEDAKSNKVNAKRCVKLAGRRLWKGLRVSCKFLWSGLILHAKPYGATDMNDTTKVWEEKLECDRKRHYSSDYSEDCKPKTKLINRGS